MDGLYRLKPWFAGRLVRLRRVLVERDISPNVISVFGVVFAGGAAVALATVPAPLAVIPVFSFLVARLACANLDGAIARETGRQTRMGAVLNEAGDRAADVVMLAGLLPHVPLELAIGAVVAGSVPSWVSLSGAAAGVRRINGGPMGKTERCLVVVLAAASGWYGVAAVVIVVGSLVTGAVRMVQLSGLCGEVAVRPR